MGATLTVTRFNDVKEINAYEAKGIKSQTRAYAATDALTLLPAYVQYVNYAQLTGNMTINATTTNLQQFDEVLFLFEADGSARTVTFGTGFLSSGTVVVSLTKGATVRGIFDGTNIRIYAREIYA